MKKAKENIQRRLNKHSCDRKTGKIGEAWDGPERFYVLVSNFPLWAVVCSRVK